MKKSFALFTVIVTLLLAPVKTFAWGEKGHTIVAETAFSYLDKATQKKVMYYLDGMTLQEAANWMDKMRKNRSYNYMKPYHYVNFNKNETVKEVCCNNIITTLNTTIRQLKDPKQLSKEAIKINLLYLFHLIGDLHQPLHVGYGHDKGGNQFQVKFNNRGTNLHRLYDTDIIQYKRLTLQECLHANTYTAKQLKAIQKIDVVAWAEQSRSYLEIVYDTKGRTIDNAYVNANYPIIKEQIHKAGIRLAAVLKQSFKA
jgi:hypothetical protein